MGFRKCTDSDFDRLKKMGFEFNISGDGPKVVAFPGRWVETGQVGLSGRDDAGCLCAGHFQTVIRFSPTSHSLRTDFVAIKVFSVEEYGESDRCNEGDLIVYFDGIG